MWRARRDDLIVAEDFNDQQKAKIAMALAKADKNIEDGGDEELALLSVCSQIQIVVASA